jgi:hypothetical protein
LQTDETLYSSLFQQFVFFILLFLHYQTAQLNAHNRLSKGAEIHNLLENVNKIVQKNFCIR